MSKDYKTISFYKFAQNIGAVKQADSNEDINVEDLLFGSYIFLNRDVVLTSKEQKEYNIFKDRYNRYLQYCIQSGLVAKDKFQEVKELNITAVPDMSKIKVADISQELEQMDIDLDKIGEMFGKLSGR
jgi:hypothetical protein